MMGDLRLFGHDDIQAAFVDWLRTIHGRRVEAAFRQAAIRWLNAGHDRCSAKMLAEAIRWSAGLEGLDPDGFKINNNHVSRLARHIVSTTPQLPSDFFQMRQLRDDLAGAA